LKHPKFNAQKKFFFWCKDDVHLHEQDPVKEYPKIKNNKGMTRKQYAEGPGDLPPVNNRGTGFQGKGGIKPKKRERQEVKTTKEKEIIRPFRQTATGSGEK